MKLTPRQVEISRQLDAGLTYGKIGETLGISSETVRNHVAQIVKRIPADFAPLAPAKRRAILWYRQAA